MRLFWYEAGTVLEDGSIPYSLAEGCSLEGPFIFPALCGGDVVVISSSSQLCVGKPLAPDAVQRVKALLLFGPHPGEQCSFREGPLRHPMAIATGQPSAKQRGGEQGGKGGGSSSGSGRPAAGPTLHHSHLCKQHQDPVVYVTLIELGREGPCWVQQACRQPVRVVLTTCSPASVMPYEQWTLPTCRQADPALYASRNPPERW